MPPPGPVTFALAWPEAGIEEVTVAIDGECFRAAAAEAVKLWEPLTDEEHEELMTGRRSGRR